MDPKTSPLALLILCLTLSVDNLAVSAAYSLAGRRWVCCLRRSTAECRQHLDRRIARYGNALVAGFNAMASLMSVFVGSYISPFLSPAVGSSLAGCVFIVLGLCASANLPTVGAGHSAARGQS